MKTNSPKKSASKKVAAEIEQKLNEISEKNQKQLQNIFQHVPAATAVLEGHEHTYILANEAYQKLFNRQEKDLLGKSLHEVFPELKDSGAFELVDHVFETGESFNTPEYPLFVDVHNDGLLRQGYYNFSMEPLKNDLGEIYAVIAMIYDVTKHVESRKKIEESEEKYRTLFSSIDQGFTLCELIRNKEGKAIDLCILEVNPTYEQQTGVKKETVLGKPLLQAFPTYHSGVEIYASVVDNQRPVVFEQYFKVTDRWFAIKAYPVGGDRFAGLFRDITERKKAEEKIIESERQIREIKENLELSIRAGKIGVWFWDVKKDKLTWSNEQKEIYGFSASDIITSSAQFNALIVPEDLKRIQDDLGADSKSDHEYDFRIIRKNDGELRWVKSRARNTFDSQGALQSISGVNIDVTEQVLALNRILESESRFRIMADASPILIWTLDANGLSSYYNKTFLDFIGASKDEDISDWKQIIHPDDFQSTFNTINTAISERITYSLECRLLKGDGQWRWVLAHGNPLLGMNYEFLGFVGSSVDITERKQAEEKRLESEQEIREIKEQLELSIGASKIGVWFWDIKNDKLTWSNEQKEMYGFSASEVITSAAQVNDLVIPEDLKRIQVDENDSNKIDYEHNFRIIRKNDGELRWIKSRARNTFDSQGAIQFICGVNIDVTEQKLFEEKLIEAKTFAENAAKSRQQFLSTMSHEIRTPLNSIIGFTNVLFKTKLGTEQKEFVQAIQTSGKSLNLLINDILDLAKVDAGKMTFETQPFEIRKSITSLIHSFDIKIREKNLALDEEYDNKIPSILLGDSLRLNQIFLNLISNAVKFTHKGKIKLSVELLSETAENVTLKFVVADSGIGIADNKLDSIFNLFEQAEHSTSTSYGGTGLGLAIVKQLVELQGGRIGVKSKLGEGSAFSFVLPFGKTNIKLEAEIEILKPDSEIKNLRVLVAEDVALNQLLIKIILNYFGFEYEIVGNGKLAIEKMQTNNYDIILMDLQMPEMNGFEATEYIRKTLKSHIPIIALTADVTTMDVSKCKEFGMDSYISKPIEEKLLYNKIVELVKKNK